MPCTIIATPGASDANSYCTVAEASTYNDSHVSGAAWTSASDDAKCRALCTATRLLDSYVQWLGSPATETQSLAWPRTDMVWVPGCTEGTDGYVSSITIPPQLKNATAEYARALIGGDPTAPNPTELAGLAALTAGAVQIVFRSPVDAAASASRAVVPGSVVAYLKPWVLASGASRSLIRT